MSVMSQYITEEQSWMILERVMEVPDPRALMDKDRLEFLDRLCYDFQHKVPFHNMALMSTPKSERQTPSMTQNIDWLVSGIGGLCWTINSALCAMLRAVGLKCHLTQASTVTTDALNHVIIVVRHLLTDGDTYLVDVGCPDPFFRVVCMDFAEASPIFVQSFREYQYIRRGDSIIRKVRSRAKFDPVQGIVTDNPWKEGMFFSADLEPDDLDVLARTMTEKVYRCPNQYLTFSLKAVRFLNERLVALKNDVLLSENEQHMLTATPLRSDTEILDALRRYFPEIPDDMARGALRTWREEEKADGYVAAALMR